VQDISALFLRSGVGKGIKEKEGGTVSGGVNLKKRGAVRAFEGSSTGLKGEQHGEELRGGEKTTLFFIKRERSNARL